MMRRLDGLPMDRTRYFSTGEEAKLALRKNTDRNARGEARRRGSQRVHEQRLQNIGLSAHQDMGSYLLRDESDLLTLRSLLQASVWTLSLQTTAGSLQWSPDTTQDFTLFRAGGIQNNPATGTDDVGSVEILMRPASAGLDIVARLTYTGSPGTMELSLRFKSPLPDPTDVALVVLGANGDTITLTLIDDGGTQTTSGTFAASNRTFSSSMWLEVTLLGRTPRAVPAINPEPSGPRPVLAEVSLWDKAITPGGSSELQLKKRISAIAPGYASDPNLFLYLPLSDGKLMETTDARTGARNFLCPGPPVMFQDDVGGAVFSGTSGHVRIPYNPLFDVLFTRRSQQPVAQSWSVQALVIPENSVQFPDGEDATIVQWGYRGAVLCYLRITNVGTGASPDYRFRVTVRDADGPVTVTSSHSLNAANDVRWLVTVTRQSSASDTTKNKLSLIVSWSGGGGGTDVQPSGGQALVSPYGPEFDEQTAPDVLIGAAFDPDTDRWERRYRGRIKRVTAFLHTVPVTSNAPGGKEVGADNALFYHRLKFAKGWVSYDQGLNGIPAFFEGENVNGLEAAPPVWMEGPVPDGEFVAATSGACFTESEAFLVNADPVTGTLVERTDRGYLHRKLGTDLVATRVGHRLFVVSNNYPHVIDEVALRARPLGLPMPTARPGVVPIGPGVLHGVLAVGYTYVSKDGTESPFKLLDPIVVRNSTIGIGGSEDQPASIYGDGNATGYWRLIDRWNGSTYERLPTGTYTIEALGRMSPDVTKDTLREEIFDRCVAGRSSWDNFWGQENSLAPGDIRPTEAFTAQIGIRLGAVPTNPGDNAVILAIGPGGTNTGSNDPANPITLVLRNNAGNPRLRLYVASGPKISSGWTTTDFATVLSANTDYNIILVFDGENYKVYINDALDTTTSTIGAAVQGTNQLNHLMIGADYAAASPITNTGKMHKESRYHLLRFWDRAVPATDIPAMARVFLDPVEDARLLSGLLREYRFATDNPFDEVTRVDCRVSSEFINFSRTTWTSGTPVRMATADQVWNVDAASARLLTFLAGTPATPFDSPLQLLWSRVGNGSILCTSGSNLIYYAANDGLSPFTPPLPVDPQAWCWYTAVIATTDTGPTLNVQTFWINGVRVYAGGGAVTRPTGGAFNTYIANIAGWEQYGSVSPRQELEAHCAEFRCWNSEKYIRGGDFLWLTSRVGMDLWDSLVYYYQMARLDGSGNVPNDGTADTTPAVDALETTAPADLVTVSSTPISRPPWPDIVGVQFYRSDVLPVQDFEDEDELDRLKRIARAGPFYKTVYAPAGLKVAVDGIPDEAKGEPARPAAGYVPKHVTGVFSWNGQPCLFGDPLHPLRIYTPTDPLDFEAYEPSGYVEIEGCGFEAITAAIEAGDSVFIFGRNGYSVFRGAPGQLPPQSFGAGIGAETARCVAALAGTAFVFGAGGLWALGQDGSRQDIGRPVQDLLPADPAQARLIVSGDSLLVIDESDGDVLRLDLRDGRWSLEEGRNLRGLTPRGGTTYLVHRSGFLAEDGIGYADDVRSSQILSGSVTGGSSTTLTASSTPFPEPSGSDDGCLGQLVALLRADGSREVRAITANTASQLTVSPAWSGAAPASGDTWAIGAFETLLDSGWILADRLLTLFLAEIARVSGTWQLGLAALDGPGDPDADTGIQWTTHTASDHVTGSAGRFVRVALRNRLPAAASVAAWLADVRPVPAEANISE